MGRQKPLQKQQAPGAARFACFALGVVIFSGYLASGQRPAIAESAATDSNSFAKLAAGAQAAMDANRIPEAIRLYTQATALRPSWSEGWWYLGTLCYDSNRTLRARDAFLHFVSVEHKQPGPGFGMLGLTEFQLRDYPKALAALERGRQLGLGDNSAFVDRALYVDGILENLLGNPEIALVRLTFVANQLAAQHPGAPKEAVLEDAELLDAFGLAALRMQKLPEAIPAEERAVVRQAGHAQALIAEQDRTTAGTELQELVGQYPSHPGMHYMYGVYLLKEDPPSAVKEFRREIDVSPDNAAAYVQVALDSFRSADYQEGLKFGEKATALAPDNFVARVVCGRILLELGETKRAMGELRTAVRLSPGSPDAHFALSRALNEAGLKAEADEERREFERLRALSNEGNR